MEAVAEGGEEGEGVEEDVGAVDGREGAHADGVEWTRWLHRTLQISIFALLSFRRRLLRSDEHVAKGLGNEGLTIWEDDHWSSRAKSASLCCCSI